LRGGDRIGGRKKEGAVSILTKDCTSHSYNIFYEKKSLPLYSPTNLGRGSISNSTLSYFFQVLNSNLWIGVKLFGSRFIDVNFKQIKEKK